MSLTSKQIDELRAYAKGKKGELAKLINDAADTIEMLSAKLHASQMERSSQYYHGGWIPCSERLPEGRTEVIVSCTDDSGDTKFRYTSSGWVTTDKEYWIVDNEINNFVVAWMPLPEPYREERRTDADTKV